MIPPKHTPLALLLATIMIISSCSARRHYETHLDTTRLDTLTDTTSMALQSQTTHAVNLNRVISLDSPVIFLKSPQGDTVIIHASSLTASTTALDNLENSTLLSVTRNSVARQSIHDNNHTVDKTPSPLTSPRLIIPLILLLSLFCIFMYKTLK